MKVLDEIHVPYRVVVERQEFDDYAKVLGAERLLVLPQKYKDDYDVVDNLNLPQKGSGPARNFVWDHAVSTGAAWHWIMDDNIYKFYYFNRNLKHLCTSGRLFHDMESFCLRYKNISMAGPNYAMFVPRKQVKAPFVVNTRIFSCQLIRNDAPFRWRARYNEDVDLSLRMLKKKWCTVLFNAFLAAKIKTQSLKGGNTDTIYQGGTYNKSKTLVEMHPDVAQMKWRFSRVHHIVNYKIFTHPLILADGIKEQ